jgi:capsular polysaccharide transport system permease protein
MTEQGSDTRLARLRHYGRSWLSIRALHHLRRIIFVMAVIMCIYWVLFASDRYVSQANVIIRSTDSAGIAAFDLVTMVSGATGVNRGDQLLLREYLLSVDMLKKLDAKLDLRSHYSDSSHDIFSRMWFRDAPLERFYLYYLSRVNVDYDDFAGVLRISVQAYNAKTAQAITAMLVQEGEDYMNQLGHERAETQVNFLIGQVSQAQQRFQDASQDLLHLQNSKGLLSPQATVESINTIVAGLEAHRAQIQTQLASLPKALDPDHPNIVLLKQSLAAVDRQIEQERAKLATPSGKPLNAAIYEFQRLQMQVSFTQDVYKSSLAALEKGRIDAARMLEKVSVLQAPTLPEYPMEPRRIYSTILTLLAALALGGLLKLFESIVLDHVD